MIKGRGKKKEDSSSYDKTSSQLICDKATYSQYSKHMTDSAARDKMVATREKRFILTLLMLSGKDYCLGPCF